MKKQLLKITFIIAGLFLLFININAQNITITDDNLYAGDNSAMLDVNCTSKGLLIPRLTNNDRDGISTPAAGLIIFNTETNCINFYNGTEWLELMGCGFPDAPDAITGTDCPYEFETGVTYSIDAVGNGDETDVDCGGPDCPDCPNNSMCETYSDCISGVCVDGICQPPACDDGVQNGLETGVDCGGPDCPPCKK